MADLKGYISGYRNDLQAFGKAVKEALNVGLSLSDIIANCPHQEQAVEDLKRLNMLNAQPNMEARAKWAPRGK